MSYSEGSASWKDLVKDFGFKRFGDKGLEDNFNANMMEGTGDKGDGTFQLGDSEGAYMDKGIWEKNRNSDKTWEAYASVYGQEAMESKRDGNEDGLSASAFDGLVDKLYEGEGDVEPEEIVPPTRNEAKWSPEVQEAIDRVKAYREYNLSGQAAEDVYGKTKELAKQSQFYQGSDPSDESNNGAQMAADSTTAKYFDQDKYKQDYSGEYVAG